MDKYLLLIILNLPFIVLGIVRASELHHKKVISRSGLIFRILFWTILLSGLILVEPIYRFLFIGGLTDSDPMSIVDVVLITAFIFCFSIILKLYTRIDTLERKLTDLHEKLSIMHSKKD